MYKRQEAHRLKKAILVCEEKVSRGHQTPVPEQNEVTLRIHTAISAAVEREDYSEAAKLLSRLTDSSDQDQHTVALSQTEEALREPGDGEAGGRDSPDPDLGHGRPAGDSRLSVVSVGIISTPKDAEVVIWSGEYTMSQKRM